MLPFLPAAGCDSGVGRGVYVIFRPAEGKITPGETGVFPGVLLEGDYSAEGEDSETCWRRIRGCFSDRGMNRGTDSRMRVELSRPYHLVLEPATRRMAYLVFKMFWSMADRSSPLEGTDFLIKQNLKPPTEEGP